MLVLGGSAVYTLGEMLGGPVLAALAAEAAPDHLRGRYLAWNQVAWTVTGAAAPVTFAALLSQGAAVTWLGLLGLSAVGGLLTVWLGRVLPQARQRITNRAEPIARRRPRRRTWSRRRAPERPRTVRTRSGSPRTGGETTLAGGTGAG